MPRPKKNPEEFTVADDRVLLAEIVGVHGVRGLVKVKTYTELPEAIVEYGPLSDHDGREIALEIRGRHKAGLLAALPGVADRDAARALRGTQLFVPRAALPPLDGRGDEFYHADLVGLAVRLDDGEVVGEVASVQDFGAGDTLEVRLRDSADTVIVPFTRAVVPKIGLEEGYLVIDPPPGLLD